MGNLSVGVYGWWVMLLAVGGFNLGVLIYVEDLMSMPLPAMNMAAISVSFGVFLADVVMRAASGRSKP